MKMRVIKVFNIRSQIYLGVCENGTGVVEIGTGVCENGKRVCENGTHIRIT